MIARGEGCGRDSELLGDVPPGVTPIGGAEHATAYFAGEESIVGGKAGRYNYPGFKVALKDLVIAVDYLPVVTSVQTNSVRSVA